MKRILIVILLSFTIYFIATYLVSNIHTLVDSNTALLITGISSIEVKNKIIDYYNSAILPKDATLLTYDAEVDITLRHINDDRRLDIIARINDTSTCGSAGCITTIFIQNNVGEFEPTTFVYATNDLKVEDSITNGMHDIRIQADSNTILKWDGTQYVLDRNF